MIDAISKHRSVRHFDDKAIPHEVMQQLLEAAIRASNTGNMQIYSIIVTQDKATLSALSPCHFNRPRRAPPHW